MAAKNRIPIRRDWLSKTLAGTLLGFALALGCCGLFVLIAQDMRASPRAQLAMWRFIPVWLAALGGCFAFRSGARAWAWLGAANVLVFAVLVVERLP